MVAVKQIKFEGINLIYEKNKVNKSTAVNLGIWTGSYCDKVEGTAHFMEHMLFKSTRNRNSEEVSNAMGTTFQRVNARTGPDRMLFEFLQTSRKVEECFELAADMYFNSLFLKEEMDGERKVVGEEIVKLENDLSFTAFSCHFSSLFNYKRKGLSSCGTSDSIKKIDAKKFEEFKKKNFCRENFCISICSDKPLRLFKKLIKKYILPHLESNSSFNPKTSLDFLPISKPSLQVITKPSVEKNFVRITLGNVPASFKNSDLSFYLTKALTGMHGRSFKKFRNEHPLTYNAPYPINYVLRKVQTFGMRFEVSTRNLKECFSQLAIMLKELKEKGITEEEFQKIRGDIIVSEDLDIQSPPSSIRDNWDIVHLYGNYPSIKKRRKAKLKLTLEEINEFAKEFFDIKNLCVTVVGGATKKDVPTLAQLKKIFEFKESSES